MAYIWHETWGNVICAYPSGKNRSSNPKLHEKTAMKLTYDKEADALYIRLIEGEHECRVVQLAEDITLDFASGERLVGIEVLGASHLFKNPASPEVELQSILPVNALS